MNLESGAIRFANEKAEILPRNGRKTTEQVTRHAMPKIETTSTMHIDWVAFLLAVLNAGGVFLSQTTEKKHYNICRNSITCDLFNTKRQNQTEESVKLNFRCLFAIM